jgi:hypothetical protein
MSANMDKVQEAWKAVRSIQQLVETFEAGEFTIPGTDLTYEFTAQQIADLKASFAVEKNKCIDALNGITAS